MQKIREKKSCLVFVGILLLTAKCELVKANVGKDFAYYQVIVQQYQEAMRNFMYQDVLNGLSDETEQMGDYLNREILSMSRYYRNYGDPHSETDLYVYYAMDDINQDGIDEFFIGVDASGSVEPLDIFTLDGDVPTLVSTSGYRTQLYVHEDGTFSECGSGGVNTGSVSLYELPQNTSEKVLREQYSMLDGVCTYTDREGVESSISEATYFDARSNAQENCRTFSWNIIEISDRGGWEQEDEYWKYRSSETGEYYENGIYEIDGKKYYFDYMGYRFSGWRTVDDQLYYFNSKGVMQTGKKKINGMSYTFREDGTLESCGKKAVVSTTLSPNKTHYLDLDGDGTEESLYYPSGMMEMSLYINDQLLFQASTGNIEMPLRLHKIGKKGIYLEYGEYVNWSYVSHCMLRYKNGEIRKMDFDVGDPKDGLKRQSEVELVDQDTLTVDTTEMFGATSWITWKQKYHVTKNAITLQGNEFPVLGAKRKWIASKGFDVYTEPGSSEVAFRVEPGDAVKIKKIYLDGNTKYGKIVKGKQKGYINLSETEMNDIYFEDVHYAS